MSYRPSQISQGSPPEFRTWLGDELRRISQAFDQLDNLDLIPLAAEPSRYAEGLIIYADGTNFDPGDGAGPYYRSAGAWVKMDGSAAVTDHGGLTGLLDDDHTQYALLAGRAGGQTLIGGTGAGDDLTLVGTAGALSGARVNMNSPVEFGPYQPTGAAYGFNYSATEVFTGGFVGGGLNFSGTITFSNSTFIYESFRGAPTITTAVNPGFAAYTVLQALPRLEAGAGAGHNPLNQLVLNAGPRSNNTFSGTRTVATVGGINFAPTVGAEAVGAVMNTTAITGLIVAPKWDTHAGATVGLGTIRGVHCQQPAQGLFQASSGVEGMTAYIGLEVDAIPFGGTVVKAALRSGITAATNSFLLVNNGGAASLFGSGIAHFEDNAGVALGNTYLAPDCLVNWNGVTLEFAFAEFGENLTIRNPADDRILFNTTEGDGEFNFNCDRFSLGAQTGAVGNSVGQFIAGTRTVSIGGEWTDFLLTQAGNITVDAAMSLVAAWTINAPSITLGTGTVVTAAGLNIGGNPTNATNRVGARIISNPSGGAGVNAALWIPNGETRLGNVIRQDELSASQADIAAAGQWWVRDDTPNVPMFTDDAGTDWQLNGAALPPSTGLGRTLIGDGAGNWIEDTDVTHITGSGNSGFDLSPTSGFDSRITANADSLILQGGMGAPFPEMEYLAQRHTFKKSNGAAVFQIDTFTNTTRALGPMRLDRIVAGGGLLHVVEGAGLGISPVAGIGYYWVRNDAPNTPMFTADDGTESVLNDRVGVTTPPNTLARFGDGDARTNDATLTDDVELAGFTLLQNQTYTFEAFIQFNPGSATSGYRWAFQASGAGSLDFEEYTWHCIEEGGTIVAQDWTSLTTTVTVASPPDVNQGVHMTGTVQVDNVGDVTLDFQFGQETAEANTLDRNASWVRFTPIEDVS